MTRRDKDGNSVSAWESTDGIPWDRDLIGLFAKNQIRVFAAMPVLATVFATVSLQWTTPLLAASWLLSALICQFIQFRMCRSYEANPAEHYPSEWVGMLAASEFLIGACWSAPVFLFWADSNQLAQIYLIASIMSVVAVRIIIAANFMPVVLAGTGFMTFNVAICCMLDGGPVSLGLGAMAVVLEIIFIQLAVRLQQTARDMLIFRSQREHLIDELKLERASAEAAMLRAEEANKAKSQFLASMSHELRTPLNAIMGFSEIMGTELFGKIGIDAYKNYANDIHHSGHYLLGLVNDILDLSKIEAGRKEMNEAPLALPTLLEDAIHVVQSAAREKRQVIVRAIDPTLPKLYADGRAVTQMVLNLLGNALKFTPESGRIDLSAKRLSSGELLIAVRDNGPGIPAEELGELKTAFTRGSYARRKAIDGAGLGLSIVKGLAAQHGAAFEICSAPGIGTEVKLLFPASRVLSGPRGEIIAAPEVTSSQRKLIALTG